MAIKLADTLAPMGDFPAAESSNVEITLTGGVKKSVQKAYEDGDLGGGGGNSVQTTDVMSPSESKVGQVCLYVGETTEKYIKGHNYRLNAIAEPWYCWTVDLSQMGGEGKYYTYTQSANPSSSSDFWMDVYGDHMIHPVTDPANLTTNLATIAPWVFVAKEGDRIKWSYMSDTFYTIYESQYNILGTWGDITPNDADQVYNGSSEKAQSGIAVAQAVASIFADDASATITAPAGSTVSISRSSDISYLFKDDKVVPATGTTIKGNMISSMAHTFDNSTAFTSGRVTIQNFDTSCNMDYAYANSGITTLPPMPTSVTGMAGTFSNCAQFNADVTIPAEIKDISYLFNGCEQFNPSTPFALNNVVNGAWAFRLCESFNQPIGNLENISNGQAMFWDCDKFAQPVGNLNNLVDGAAMFGSCGLFNQPVGNLENLVNGAAMFSFCSNFNQLLNLVNLKSGSYMFRTTSNFDSPIGTLENLVNGDSMFFYSKFNKPLNLTNLVEGNSMFYHASEFDQPLGNLDNLVNGTYMFEVVCPTFDQPLGNLENLVIGQEMFCECQNFNQPMNLVNLKQSRMMFCNCFNFNSSVGNLENLVDGEYMFVNCQNFSQPMNLVNLKEGNGMFQGCLNWTRPDGTSPLIGNLDNLVEGSGMFMGSSFNSPLVLNNLVNGQNMFTSCSNFNQLIGNLGNLTNGVGMFRYCNNFNQPITNLTSLVNGSGMFQGSKSLLTTDSGSYYFPNLINASYMFAQPEYVSTGFSDMVLCMPNARNVSNMFNSGSNFSSGIYSPFFCFGDFPELGTGGLKNFFPTDGVAAIYILLPPTVPLSTSNAIYNCLVNGSAFGHAGQIGGLTIWNNWTSYPDFPF